MRNDHEEECRVFQRGRTCSSGASGRGSEYQSRREAEVAKVLAVKWKELEFQEDVRSRRDG